MLKTVINCHVWNRGLQNQTEKVPCTVLLNYLHTFVFNIFSVLILFIYIINIGYWQVLFITQEHLGKFQSATFTFKLLGPTAAVLAFLCFKRKRKVFVAEETLDLHKRELKESVNRNSIIMITKRYHYVINLGIFSNFYISIDPTYPGSLAKDLWQRANSRESGLSLLHRSSSPLSTMSLDKA